jgi:hypothetical protein
MAAAYAAPDAGRAAATARVVEASIAVREKAKAGDAADRVRVKAVEAEKFDLL